MSALRIRAVAKTPIQAAREAERSPFGSDTAQIEKLLGKDTVKVDALAASIMSDQPLFDALQRAPNDAFAEYARENGVDPTDLALALGLTIPAVLDAGAAKPEDLNDGKEKNMKNANVSATARAYADQADANARDTLLIAHGDRLAPNVRAWASTQKFAVVNALIKAASSTPPQPRGLQGKELEEFRQKMGTSEHYKPASQKEPHTNEQGNRVFPTVTPTEARRRGYGGGK